MHVHADSEVAIQLSTFLHGKVCSKRYDAILTCDPCVRSFYTDPGTIEKLQICCFEDLERR